MKPVVKEDRTAESLIRYLEHLRDNTHNLFRYSHKEWRDHYDSQIVAFTQQFGVNKEG